MKTLKIALCFLLVFSIGCSQITTYAMNAAMTQSITSQKKPSKVNVQDEFNSFDYQYQVDSRYKIAIANPETSPSAKAIQNSVTFQKVLIGIVVGLKYLAGVGSSIAPMVNLSYNDDLEINPIINYVALGCAAVAIICDPIAKYLEPKVYREQVTYLALIKKEDIKSIENEDIEEGIEVVNEPKKSKAEIDPKEKFDLLSGKEQINALYNKEIIIAQTFSPQASSDSKATVGCWKKINVLSSCLKYVSGVFSGIIPAISLACKNNPSLNTIVSGINVGSSTIALMSDQIAKYSETVSYTHLRRRRCLIASVHGGGDGATRIPCTLDP